MINEDVFTFFFAREGMKTELFLIENKVLSEHCSE